MGDGVGAGVECVGVGDEGVEALGSAGAELEGEGVGIREKCRC